MASSASKLQLTKAVVVHFSGFCAKIVTRWFEYYSQIFPLIKLQSGTQRSARARRVLQPIHASTCSALYKPKHRLFKLGLQRATIPINNRGQLVMM